ncbi:tubulin-specific chaperone B [Entomortierella parvispora]|uniref:Tubulin-specific chaperone B n=1 Tax=Entomortierella parvispora TaxID=205924 RepID=A0A9P3LYX9_9FUNG|nr:tubulin-specific chaperone B [Entomortierella parvispora]
MSILNVYVTSENNSTELRLSKASTIDNLKIKLEPITGISAGFQQLELHHDGAFVCSLEGHPQETMLGAFPIEEYWTVHVIDTNPSRVKGQFNDVSLVQKFELPDEEYEKRTDSVLAFKKRNNLGRFNDAASDASATSLQNRAFEEAAKSIKLGDRCEVDVGGGSLKRRGTVRFIGLTEFQAGIWVGVQYDEPLGKNDGSMQGVRYFSCAPKYGSFVRPDKIQAGDFPEEDLFSDEDM